MLALATIRRTLLELGHALQPEAPGTLVGPLELWTHQPRPELDGLSPLQVPTVDKPPHSTGLLPKNETTANLNEYIGSGQPERVRTRTPRTVDSR